MGQNNPKTATDSMQFRCPQCSEHFHFSAPQPVIMNSDEVSAVISSHVEGTYCPKCGTRYTLHIANCQILYGIVMAQNQHPKNGIITPAPSGLLV